MDLILAYVLIGYLLFQGYRVYKIIDSNFRVTRRGINKLDARIRALESKKNDV